MLTILRDFYPTLVPLALPQAPKVRLEIVVQVCLHIFFLEINCLFTIFQEFVSMTKDHLIANANTDTCIQNRPIPKVVWISTSAKESKIFA